MTRPAAPRSTARPDDRTATRKAAGPALLVALAAACVASPVRAAKQGDGAAPVAAVSAEPRETMATFGDWVVRCERPAPPAAVPGGASPPAPRRVCEAAQALVIKGQQAPVAQIAFGHVPSEGKETPKEAGEAGLTLTVLLPVNVSFDKPPRLTGPDDDGATLTFRRCLPGGCLADARPTAELLKALRAATRPGRLTFTDAAERTLTLPLSTRGLAQALDDLARETAKDAGRDSGKDHG